MAKKRDDMTTVKVRKDVAQFIYTLATANGVAATEIIEEAVKGYFEEQLKAFPSLLSKSNKTEKNENPEN